jgi:hypothetical protein
LAIVLSYFNVPEVALALNQVGVLKAAWGYPYSMASTALFGGLVPFLVLWGSGRVERQRVPAELVFYLVFWSWKGAEIDALYRAQAELFGSGSSLSVIVQKTAVDQFFYNSLWGAPTQTICFLWKDSDFSWSEMQQRLAQQGMLSRTVIVLLPTWVVWIPAVAIVYSLPSALQIPLFSLVLCFWCLLLTFVSRYSDNRPAPLEKRR